MTNATRHVQARLSLRG